MSDEVNKILDYQNINYTDYQKIQTGFFNTTYRIITPVSEHDLILRIEPSSNTGMLFYEKNMMYREPQIHEQVRKKTNIPIPHIILYDFSKSIVPHAYLIMEFMNGKPITEITLPGQASNKIFIETGTYLRQLHEKVISDKYGYPGNYCMELQNSWISAFSIMWNNLIDDIEACSVYDKKETTFAKKQLDNLYWAFDRQVQASLLHMDIWSQNILLNDRQIISGILDWDRALYGDPEIEFAVLEYVGFLNHSFLEGYGKMLPDSKEFRIRNVFYYLYEFQKYLVIWTLRRPNRAMVRNYKEHALHQLKKVISI